MSRKSLHAALFAVGFSALLLEVSYTRIFSFKLYYYFAYLVIGIGLLGFGAGGVAVALLPRLRGAEPERLLPPVCAVAGLLAGLGYNAIARVETDVLALGPVELAKLAALCALLFAPFLGAGVAVANAFGRRPRRIHSLYFADLAGAGSGCALAVPLMTWLTPPGCVLAAGIGLALAGLAVAPARRRAAPLAAAVALAALAVVPGGLPDPRTDRLKTLAEDNPWRQEVIYSRWSPVFRVDVMESDLSRHPSRSLLHDGMIGSILHAFDGDAAALDRFDTDPRSDAFLFAPERPRVLIIGAAGGHEILASLYYGAGHVTAVELNPVTVSLLRDRFADYTGRLAERDDVTLLVGEGRSFLESRDDRWDVIYFVAPDSYAAMNAATSGAFVLSESYLYTVEMLETALARLAPGGVVCISFGEVAYGRKPNRTARYLATAREAFRRRGVSDFSRHVLVATSKEIFTTSTILLRPEPFTREEAARFAEHARDVLYGAPRYAPGAHVEDGPVRSAIELPPSELAAFRARYPYEIGPVTDDAPFFWHFVPFLDAIRGAPAAGGPLDLEDALGERVLLALLGIAALFAAVFLLLPFALRPGDFRAHDQKGRVLVYFGCVGLGFMFFEICIIQMLTLFLGYPTYSLSVTLFSLLVFTGIGSLGSERGAFRRRPVARPLAVLAGLAVLYATGAKPLLAPLLGAPLWVRAVAAAALVAPLGLCLGRFLPIGLARAADRSARPAELVAWAWAVNGFFGVIGSVLTTVLAMEVGFRAVLLAAFALYLVAGAALPRAGESLTRAPAG